MVKVKNLQLNILDVTVETVSFELVSDGEKKKYAAKIIDNQGIFGVEFPKEVSLLLSYYPAQTKDFIKNLREIYFSADKLQAA